MAMRKAGAERWQDVGIAVYASLQHAAMTELKPDWCRMGRGANALAAVHGARDGGHAIHELGAEDDVGVAEHALLERDHNELGVGEVRLDHPPNVLGVAQVQGSVHLQRREKEID